MPNANPIPFNDLRRLYQKHALELEKEVVTTMRSGWWISGKSGESFADRFAAFIGTEYCIPVANGTDALQIALKTVAQEGSEVVTVANAGGYTCTALKLVGLKPVFCDVDADTLLMNIEAAVAAMGPETAAVVVTHLFGNVVNVPGLRKKMNQAGHSHVPIIEDCAQAHGAKYDGKHVGSLGDISTFSFYPTKNLGALGDAGAVLTNNEKYATLASKIRQYGWAEKYTVQILQGQNSRMDEVQASALSVFLPHLTEHNKERCSIRAFYEANLPPDVQLLSQFEGAVNHLVVIMVKERDALRSFFQAREIGSDIHYPVLDCDQPAWRDDQKNDLPISRAATKTILSIPCFVGLTETELRFICDSIKEFYAE